MTMVEICETHRRTVDINFDLAVEWFANLTDDAMARFFCDVAAIGETWPEHGEHMWYYTGRHLRDCTCSTPEGRNMITQIFQAMQPTQERDAE